jgi:hypothetical protein
MWLECSSGNCTSYWNELRLTKSGISEVEYCFSENDDSDSSAPSLINSESPPIRKIFVGNISDRVSNSVIYYLFWV